MSVAQNGLWLRIRLRGISLSSPNKAPDTSDVTLAVNVSWVWTETFSERNVDHYSTPGRVSFQALILAVPLYWRISPPPRARHWFVS